MAFRSVAYVAVANLTASAGVCGIIRTVVLSRLDVMNYTRKPTHRAFAQPLVDFKLTNGG